jgi:hypothetical protein
MITSGMSMKDVVAVLRRDAVGCLLELYELDVAVGELVVSGSGLRAALQELAGEARQLADLTGAVPSERLRALTTYAVSASSNGDAHARALQDLERGLNAWSIAG